MERLGGKIKQGTIVGAHVSGDGTWAADTAVDQIS